MKSIVIIALVCATAIAYWLIAPLFVDKTVEDELDPALKARLEAQKRVDEAREQRELENESTNESSAAIPESEPTATAEPDEFGLRSSGPFPIIDTPGHPASGVVEVIESPEEKLVYFRDYDGTNGPDLKVYLAKDLEANDFVDLGKAKGNQGDIIYGVPLDVDLSEYKYVMTWCRAFGVLFDYAEIN